MRKKKYDPDPVKAWKKQHKTDDDEAGDDAEEENQSAATKIGDYDYLLDMPMRSLTYEKKEELLKKKDEKMKEYQTLCNKTPSDLWREDLNALVKAMDDLEAAEADEMKKTALSKTTQPAKGKKRMNLVAEVMPSPKGILRFLKCVGFFRRYIVFP